MATSDLVKQARELAGKASDGPWEAKNMHPNTLGPAWIDAPTIRRVADCSDSISLTPHHGWCGRVGHEINEANAAFIAWARTGVPELCGELEKAEAERASLRVDLRILAENLHRSADENDALRADVKRLTEVLEILEKAATEDHGDLEMISCDYCGMGGYRAAGYKSIEHEPECPIDIARAALKEQKP